MARATLLIGGIGGIIVALAGFTGIIWSITDMSYVSEISSAISLFTTGILPIGLILLYGSLPLFFNPSAIILGVIFSQALTPSAGLWNSLSLILALLLLVGAILIGVGFLGMYRAGGGAMGVVGLAFGIIGGVAGSLFLFLGSTATITTPLVVIGYFTVSITTPLYLLIFIGFAILGVSLILIGVTSIVVREITEYSAAAVAAGILSIVGGCFLFPYILDYALLSVFGGIFALIGFVLILAASVILSVVFFASRNI
jgi:hypothetical protein